VQVREHGVEVLRAGAAQPPRDFEGVMMIVREGDQGR
jgi:hypothetical protein